jgi:hypothetical protein
VVLNLDRLRALEDQQAETLQRFAQSIQRQRGDVGARNLPLRLDDLRTLAMIYDTSVQAITDQLLRLQVLSPESVIVDRQP